MKNKIKISGDFQGFVFRRKILDDFHGLSSEYVFRKKINNQFRVVTVFKGKVAISIGRETKHTYFSDENQRKHR